MSRRVRTTRTSVTQTVSTLKSKNKPAPIRKMTRSTIQKKSSVKNSSPTKRNTEQTSSTSIQTREKRLSSLTATALLQYCSSILSPSRKLNRSVKSTSNLSDNSKVNQPSPKGTKNAAQKRRLSSVSSKSENKPTQVESHLPTRTRREASSRASAMIMQQNEIERSRYNYSLNNKQSTSTTIRRQPTKTSLVNNDNPPSSPAPVPSIINIPIEIVPTSSSNIVTTNTPLVSASTISKYPLLTEASLAEHNRLQESTPLYHTTKRDSLIKWTQELNSYDRLSPPYADHEIPSESNISQSKPTEPLIPDSKLIDPITSSHLSARPNINPTTFLFPPTTYPFDLHPYYSVLPCWQYSTWPFSSSLSTHHKTPVINHPENRPKKFTILNSKDKTIVSNPKPKHHQEESLTLHLHTHHHHHHIHNSSSSPTIVPLSSEKSSGVINPEQDLETEAILKLKDNNLPRNQSKPRSPAIENDVLNLSINNKPPAVEVVKKTTRRKSSPTKRYVNTGTKTNSSPIPLTTDQIFSAISPKKPLINDESKIILPELNSKADVSIDTSKSSLCIPKRRSISAATTNSIRTISLIDRNLREKRTHSASNIPSEIKSSFNRKRSYSPSSLTLPSPNKISNQRKKQKISNYWILFGKSEQRLVSIHADKPPVFRECYSSIQHIIEKDIIKSNDCIVLRPDMGTSKSTTPYLAKVKWFWKEPTTDEIHTSLIWYYHPEHTDLPARAKQCFLPNEVLASRYSDCVNVACIEDKCYVLNLNEYNRYCLREKSSNIFEHPEPVAQLKSLLNKNTSTIHHRSLPGITVGNQNIFFCRYVYDYRANRILKNPSLNHFNSFPATSSV